MLVERLLAANEKHSQRLAVDDGRTPLTYARLTSLAMVLRDVLLRETQLDRVGVMLPASAAFPAALFGTLWASKTVIPLNFLLSSSELARIAEDAGLDLILTIEHFRELVEPLPVRKVYMEHLPLKRKVFFTLLRRTPAPPVVREDDTAVLLYTSGTTAEPKGVELTYGNLHSNCMDTIEMLRIDPEQRFLNILPPFHVFGLTANVLVPVCLGATVFAIPRFSPVALLKAVPEHRITVMMAIPSMYAALLRSKSATPETFVSIYLAISGGEPLPEKLRVAVAERFGLTLYEGYGLTETSPVVSVNTPHAHRAGSVGKPIPHVEVRLVDDQDVDVPPDGEGEILVRGPGVMKGYYRKPEETARVLTPDRWFRTGDIGRLQDGFLSITGRRKEMLIIGGENVFPREIEAVLEDHPAVLQAAVIGVPDESRGEAPIAFVILKDGASVEEIELRNHAKKALAGFKVPKRVVIREELPTTPTGKILKRRLKELLREIEV